MGAARPFWLCAALLQGLRALPHNEVGLSAMQTVKATRATDKASEQSGVLQELRVQKAALSSLQEKKAEEEGALEVLQAREKQLSTELQELLSRRTNSGALSFLQEYAESGNAESAERRSQQQAEDDRLARAESSLGFDCDVPRMCINIIYTQALHVWNICLDWGGLGGQWIIYNIYIYMYVCDIHGVSGIYIYIYIHMSYVSTPFPPLLQSNAPMALEKRNWFLQ